MKGRQDLSEAEQVGNLFPEGVPGISKEKWDLERICPCPAPLRPLCPALDSSFSRILGFSSAQSQEILPGEASASQFPGFGSGSVGLELR